MSSSIQLKNNIQIVGNLESDKTLILVHGFGTDQTYWNAIVPSFLQSYRIIKFDQVGAGLSNPAEFVQHRYLGLHNYAKDIVDICQYYEVRNAHILGHSVGGMISALATIQAPQYFSKLVMLASSPRYLNDGGYHGGFTETDLNQIYRGMMENFTGWAQTLSPVAMNSPERPELAQRFAETLGKIKPEYALTVLCSILQSDHRKDLAKITLPTLIIQSLEDYFVPLAVAVYMSEQIPNSQLSLINAKGHFPQLTAPEEVVNAMNKIL